MGVFYVEPGVKSQCYDAVSYPRWPFELILEVGASEVHLPVHGIDAHPCSFRCHEIPTTEFNRCNGRLDLNGDHGVVTTIQQYFHAPVSHGTCNPNGKREGGCNFLLCNFVPVRDETVTVKTLGGYTEGGGIRTHLPNAFELGL